jgi:biopolymer transport protein TolQ
MTSGIMGNSIWQLVRDSDAMTWVVLITLLALSVISWTVFLYKFLVLRIKKKQLARVNQKMRELTSAESVLALSSTLNADLPSYFLAQNALYIKSMLTLHGKGNTMTTGQWELVSNNMDRILDDMIGNEESYLPVLSTSAAISPLLGLFGTVWGLIHSFISISQRGSADIVTVAPGIAEALITTLFGLLVAIPAMMMFNYLAAQVRSVEHSLIRLADQFGRVVQHVMVRDEVQVSNAFNKPYVDTPHRSL